MATSKSTTVTGTGFKLSVMTLAIMNVTAVVSLRGLPSEAVYGPSSAFYYLFAAIAVSYTHLRAHETDQYSV